MNHTHKAVIVAGALSQPLSAIIMASQMTAWS